ncbi:hypothetical protein HD806DRAFT_500250 [Xylariaceae sp. AK1471]|nr:hypothetical protein HD806DRAFT_500250 [Xylariaceae sp. AK1471]
MAAPLHRHQSSLEGILNFSPPHPPLETELRNHASRRFHDICQHFDTDIPFDTGIPGPADNYSRPRLVRFTYEYSLSQDSRDYFLSFFFKEVGLPIDGNEPLNFGDVRAKFFDFAEYLFDNFFLPVKASTKKTPQSSPALRSAVQEAQGHSGQQYVGTGLRLSVLRRDCLIRDRYRCVISRRFDFTEAMKRRRTPGGPRDDDNNLIANDPIEPDQLEVAHILPHSLVKTNQRGELVRIFYLNGLLN